MSAHWMVWSNSTAIEASVFIVAGSATIFSTVFTAYLIFRHFKHYTYPEEQRAIVRILFMVVVYSLSSLLAIVLGNYSLFFTLVRDCYEAYVLYQFFSLLVYYVKKEAPGHFNIGEDEQDDIGHLLTYFGEHQFPFPLCVVTYQSSNRIYLHIKRCALQYVFIKPLIAAIAILLEILGIYHAGSFDVKHAYFYLTMLLNTSALVAVYFIFLFYDLIKKVIWMHRPLHKLVAIKILVFFVFWQAIALSLLYYFHLIPAFFGWSEHRSAETVQNLLICLEMTGLSVFNLYAFPYQSYRTVSGEDTLDNSLGNLQSVLSQHDLVSDAVDVFHPDRLKHAIDKRDD